MRKYLLCFVAFFALIFPAWACDVCQRSQPKLLQDISHGTGPQSDSDYYIIGAAVILVLFTLLYSLKYLIKPGEGNPKHIKNLILTNPPTYE